MKILDYHTLQFHEVPANPALWTREQWDGARENGYVLIAKDDGHINVFLIEPNNSNITLGSFHLVDNALMFAKEFVRNYKDVTNYNFRIGNYVKYDGDIVWVTNLSANNIYVSEHPFTDQSLVEPIRLSGEWAERLGYVTRDGARLYTKIEGAGLYTSKGANIKLWVYDDKVAVIFCWSTLCYIKYVHELQNLLIDLK